MYKLAQVFGAYSRISLNRGASLIINYKKSKKLAIYLRMSETRYELKSSYTT